MTFFNGVARRPARPTWSVRTEFVFATVHRGGHSPAATFEWSAVNLERDPVVNGLGGHTNHHSKQVRLEPMSPIRANCSRSSCFFSAANDAASIHVVKAVAVFPVFS